MVPTNTLFSRALSSPLELIDELAKSNPPADLPQAVSHAFKEAFGTQESRKRIPFLTPQNAEGLVGKTVRWRAMVQDNSLGNEIVLATMPASGSRGPRTALYGGDALGEVDEGETSSATNEAFTSPKQEDLSERAVIHACSLPGRSAWAAQGDAAFASLEEAAGNRTTGSAAAAASSSSSTSSTLRGIKSKLPLGDDDPSAMGVILKIYDLPAAEALQISDVVDVVGILDRSSMPNAEWASTGAPSSSSSCPPAAQLHPALHVVLLETSTHVWMGPMPLLRPGSASEFGESEDLASATASLSVADKDDFEDDVEKSRASLISELAKRLQGDEVAAEWALLASIASIHTRKAPFALGHLSLRLLLPASPEEGDEEKDDEDGDLATFLSTVLPSVAPLDVTLESLNAAHVRFAPRNGGEAADDEGLGLLSGRLQLPRGTTVVVRESMAEGRLSSHGLENLQALQGVLKKQSLGYVFPYSPSPYDLPVDLPMLVVSSGADLGEVQQTGEGSTSASKRRRRAAATGGLVEADVDVAVQPRRSAAASAAAAAAGPSTPSSSLTTMRRHLIKSRRLATSLHVSESVAQAIQQDFVSSRSSGTSASSASSQEDLLRRMDVARLLAASECRYDLTFEDYKRAKELDVQRGERLRVRREEVKRSNAGAVRGAASGGAGSAGQAAASR